MCRAMYCIFFLGKKNNFTVYFITICKLWFFLTICGLPICEKTHLSELAGLLVLGLKIHTFSNAIHIKYTRPTLKGVKRSKSLQTKWPPGNNKKK